MSSPSLEALYTHVKSIAADMLGVGKDTVENYTVDKSEPRRELALPRPRAANIFVVIEAQGELVIRHEGGDDFTEFEVAGYRVPGILNTKIQSAERRALLRLLYSHYERSRDRLLQLLDEASKKWGDKALPKTGWSSVVEKLRRGWRCYMAPRQGRKKDEETVVPYCGFCPNCMIYGYAGLEEAGSYNVKSRVEGDVFYGLCPSSSCVAQRTFNAVDDVTKTTFYGEEAATGALFQLSLIEPGTVFLGKIVLRDPSPAELLAVLLAVAHVERIGARTTHFGRVKTHIPALVLSHYERGTGYEAAARMLRARNGARLGLEEAIEGATSYAESVAVQDADAVILRRDLADALRKMKLEDIDTVLTAAWLDGLAFKSSIELFLYTK